MDAEAQGLGPFSVAFPDHKHRAGSEVKQLRLELAPIWDASATGSARVLHHCAAPSVGHSRLLWFSYLSVSPSPRDTCKVPFLQLVNIQAYLVPNKLY